MVEKVFIFDKSLKQSQHDQDLAFWKKVYTDCFGEGIVIIKHSEYGSHQKDGIDRSVILPDSRQFLIEEKVDWYQTGNLFLEYWSMYEDRSPGWIEKSLRCDYLVYAFPKCGQAFLFDFLQLQKTWFANKQQWLQQFGKKTVRNTNGCREWTTIGVTVPVKLVYERYHQHHCFRFDKMDSD